MNLRASVGIALTAGMILLGAPAWAQEVQQDVKHDVSPPLRDIIAPPNDSKRIHEKPLGRIPVPPSTGQADPVVQTSVGPKVAVTSGSSFDGVGVGFTGPNGAFSPNAAPPDTNGAVGATQFVQWVNGSFAVFSKATGAAVLGPIAGNALWQGFGGGCETNNDGDPIAQYDKAANRWILTQFSVSTTPFLQCVAVSTTSDATGSYFRYAFTQSNFPDYPKLGVWPDAYYVTFNMFSGNRFVGANACAFDRSKMLAGTAATQICFQQTRSVASLLPSDQDGSTPPPAGSPNFMVNFGTNSLNLFKFHVDFGTPSNSTFTGPTTLAVAAFSPACSGGACIPQQGTNQLLDSLADRLMYRFAYRNFGDHEALVLNHSVTAGSSVGVRWYEIRSPNTAPALFQQGTFAPDANFRWMGSIGMDQAGDIAVGYSVSSTSVFPSISFTGRIPSDPLNTLEAENSIQAGSGSQNGGLNRWGDYSSIAIDPVDDCTFWYTTEYLKTSGSFNWSTRIANFKFPGCGNPPTTVTTNPSGLGIMVDGQSFTAPQVFNWAPGSSHTIAVSSPQNGPAGTHYAWSSWSDGGAISHSVTAGSAPATFTANFTTQFLLTLAASPGGGGTVAASPASGDGYYASGTSVQVTANASAGFQFTNFSGDLTGSTNPQSVAMSAPRSVTGNFTAGTTVTTNPPNLSISVDGTTYTAPQTFNWASGSGHTVAVNSPQNGPAGMRYAWSSWSDGGAISHSVTSGSTPVTLTANFGAQYLLTFVSSPGGGGTLAANPVSGDGFYASGSSVQVTASANASYQFANFTGDLTGATNPQSVTMSAPRSVTGNFNVANTVTTSPAGLSISVDGSTYTAPQTFNWTPGSGHTVAVTSPQNGAAGTRYAWSSWSDGGAISHSITAGSAPATFTANFGTQFLLTFVSSPGGGGTLTANPISGDGYYTSAASVQVTASANAGYQFANFSGDLTGSTNPQSVTMSAPRSVTASFNVATTLTTSPAGLSITVDGVTSTAPQTFNWVAGSSHTIAVSSPQSAAAGTRYAWASWSDGGAVSHTFTVGNTPGTVTANFNTQFLLTLASSPVGGGTLAANPTSADGYYTNGASVQVTGTANAGYQFANFSGDLTGSADPQSFTMSAPRSVTANFNVQATVTTNPSGLSVTVDGQSFLAPQTFSWPPASSHTLAVASAQSGAAGTRYVWSAWSDGGAISHMITTSNAVANYTASFGTQYFLTMSAGSGGSVSPQSNWFNAGQSVSISATPSAGYSFAGWSGSGVVSFTGTSSNTSVTMNGPITESATWTASISTSKAAVFRNGLWVIDLNDNFQWDGPGIDRAIALGQSGDIPVTGDWNGDGRKKAGIFRNGLWVLDYNGNGQWDGTTIDRAYFLGQAGDIPVVGDWNGSGFDKIGIFRNGLWVLDYNGNGQWDGPGAPANPNADVAYTLGQAGDVPVVGDWNGSGWSKFGVFRNGLWVLDYNGNFQWDGTSIDRAASLGQSGDVPVVGDWNGSGKSKIGIFRNGLWVLDYNGNFQWDGPGAPGNPNVDVAYTLGQTGDTPVVGDWNASGWSKIGVFRNGLWVFDYNGNFQWDGTTIDRAMFLGQMGDVPVPAKW